MEVDVEVELVWRPRMWRAQEMGGGDRAWKGEEGRGRVMDWRRGKVGPRDLSTRIGMEVVRGRGGKAREEKHCHEVAGVVIGEGEEEAGPSAAREPGKRAGKV